MLPYSDLVQYLGIFCPQCVPFVITHPTLSAWSAVALCVMGRVTWWAGWRVRGNGSRKRRRIGF